MFIKSLITFVIIVIYIFDANSQVNLKWQACYIGPANNWDTGFAVAFDDSGYVYVTGASVGIGTDRDYATIKYTP
jgi:hypothetical protein